MSRKNGRTNFVNDFNVANQIVFSFGAVFMLCCMCAVWDLDDDTGLPRFKQRTSADRTCQLLGVLG
jgi:hypothetical protein